MRPFFAAAVAVCLAGPALAQAPTTAVHTVADLAAVCGPADALPPVARLEAIAYCQGFVTAAGQYHAALHRAGGRHRPLFCLPTPAPSVAQAAVAFVAWAGENPTRAGEPALDGLLRFAQAAYPCPTPARRAPAPR
ncbi:Rap1a/Tai family immunity protein [Humitalea sp. 24SJ18S-53]|uniref:Rap1a/Tai family immunity protein n=1 Tax=Humitalea sp. 24SJ18S-53 TaxID=3422307 RepID=UPI003D67CA4A